MKEVDTGFVQALINGDQHQAWKIVQSIQEEKLDSLFIYDQLITPAMRKIGDMWERNEITVADEHLATSTCEFVMSYYHAKKKKKHSDSSMGQPRAAFMCIEHEHHDIGLKIISNLFQEYDWETKYLGANLPIKEFISFAEKWKPEVIGISITIPNHLSSLVDYLKEIDRMEHQPTILIGGSSTNDYELKKHCSNPVLVIKDANELKEWLTNDQNGVSVSEPS